MCVSHPGVAVQLRRPLRECLSAKSVTRPDYETGEPTGEILTGGGRLQADRSTKADSTTEILTGASCRSVGPPKGGPHEEGKDHRRISTDVGSASRVGLPSAGPTKRKSRSANLDRCGVRLQADRSKEGRTDRRILTGVGSAFRRTYEKEEPIGETLTRVGSAFREADRSTKPDRRRSRTLR